MAAPVPPQIIVNDPTTTSDIPSAEPTPRANGNPPKPQTPAIDTSPATTARTTNAPLPTNGPILNRTNTLSDTPISAASCYLCDEQNPGDFTPTTKHLSACQLCSRYFCPIHVSPQFDTVCNINHSSYYHDMLQLAKRHLDDLAASTADNTTSAGAAGPTRSRSGTESRTLAEVLISEGIYPSLGEREKAIFATSPVDERKKKELESWRSLEAAVANGGERGRREPIEVREAVGADIAI